MKYITLLSVIFSFVFFSNTSFASDKLGYARVRIQTFEEGIQIFQKDTGNYPSTEQGLNSLIKAPPGISGWNGPYLPYPIIPTDPWDEEYRYFYPAKIGDKEFDLYSKGKNKVDEKGQADDISNWRGHSLWQYNKKSVMVYCITFLIGLIIVVFLTKLLVNKRQQSGIIKNKA